MSQCHDPAASPLCSLNQVGKGSLIAKAGTWLCHLSPYTACDEPHVFQGKAVTQARHASGAHSCPVWQVQWVDRGPLGGVLLISASADGRMTQWTSNQARNGR